MAKKYQRTTTLECPVCDKLLEKGYPKPILDNNYPQKLNNEVRSTNIHNWFHFVLGYSPSFVDYIIKKKNIKEKDVVLDPFVGTGTTLVECKKQGINSMGLDANDFLVYASKVKTNWDLNLVVVKNHFKKISSNIRKTISNYSWSDTNLYSFDLNKELKNPIEILDGYDRPDILYTRYISDKPLAKLLIIKEEINKINDENIRNLFSLGLASILVPSSNVRFGPGFGLKKPVDDVDVYKLLVDKISRMISDLEKIQNVSVNSDVILGDTRNLSDYVDDKIFHHVITSPPYPADHEYTRQTRLELAFLDFAKTKLEVRQIKKRLMTSSTRNVYVSDNDRVQIQKYSSVTSLVEKIEQRVIETNGTSGFEKLYGKLVAEYFGGMYLCLEEIHNILSSNGTVALLVGDTHAFKMVHIETGKILEEIAEDIGFGIDPIELWKLKRSTSHNFPIPEYIVNLYKK